MFVVLNTISTLPLIWMHKNQTTAFSNYVQYWECEITHNSQKGAERKCLEFPVQHIIANSSLSTKNIPPETCINIKVWAYVLSALPNLKSALKFIPVSAPVMISCFLLQDAISNVF